jgi:hypothetical protein
VITITFNEQVDKDEAEDAFTISPTVSGTFSWNDAGTVLTFTPSSNLEYGREYNVTMDADGIVDLLGNGMLNDKTWTFTTGPAPSGTPGTVRGKVVDEEGNPIQGARVRIEGTALSTTTDENGEFTLENVPAGDYSLEVEKDGYEQETSSVTVSEGQITDVPTSTLMVESEDDGEEASYLPLILILIVIVVVVVVLVLLMMRKKKEPQGFDDQGYMQETSQPQPTQPMYPQEAPPASEPPPQPYAPPDSEPPPPEDELSDLDLPPPPD